MDWEHVKRTKMSGTDESKRSKFLIDELCEMTDWPMLIKAEKPHLGETEEPLVALGVQSFLRISACIHEEHLLGTAPEVTEKSQRSIKYAIPMTLSDEGQPVRFQVLSLRDPDHIYPTMKDLLEYRPRYFKPTKAIVVGKTSIKKGKTLEFKKLEGNCCICQQVDGTKRVDIALSARGDFKIVKDTNKYTITDAARLTFKLPQRVMFETLPAGLPDPDVVFLDQHKFHVLITLPLGGLFHDPGDEGYYNVNSGLVNFLFLPASTDGFKPLEDCYFYLWSLGSPGSITQEQISKRASHYSIDRFKDINVVLPESSASIQSCAAESVYEYLPMGKPEEPPQVYETFDPSEYIEPDIVYFPNGREEIKTKRRPPPPIPSEAEGQEVQGKKPTPVPRDMNRQKPPPLPAKDEPKPTPDLPRRYANALPLPGMSALAQGKERACSVPLIPLSPESVRNEEQVTLLPVKIPPLPTKENRKGAEGYNEDNVSLDTSEDRNLTGTISELDTSQLSGVLKHFGLKGIAAAIEAYRIDGHFFSTLSEEDFKGRPFHASPFEIRQIERVKQSKTSE